MQTTQFYINGAWVDPVAATPLDVIDPSTEEPCARISLGGQADTDAAVAAARAAFPAWAEVPVADRIAALERLFAAYTARSEDIAQAVSREMGAPIDMARQQQVTSGDWHFDGFLRAARGFDWDMAREGGERVFYEPIGVSRADHAVELAAQPDRPEGRARACGGLHHGAETLRDRAALGADLCRGC